MTAASVLLFMTLINKIHEIVILCKGPRGCIFGIFWLMQTVGSRELPGALPPLPTPAESSKPSRPQLQGTMVIGHCILCLWHNIHASCDLQTKNSGKSTSILVEKLRENDAENSVRTLLNIGLTTQQIVIFFLISVEKIIT